MRVRRGNEAIRFGGYVIGGAFQLFENMQSSGARMRAAVALTAAILVVAAALALPSRMTAADAEVTTFQVDVALGLPYFQNNIDPAETKHNPNAFSPGDTFIEYGNIYPAGTIPNGKTDFDPATPGIGRYIVRGTWTTDLANFERAAAHDTSAAPDMAFATEIFFLQNNHATILTDGMYPNAYFSAPRVVFGGTGSYRGMIGEIQEENIGENKLGLCNFRVTFKIRK